MGVRGKLLGYEQKHSSTRKHTERERERSENYVASKFVNSRQKFEPKI